MEEHSYLSKIMDVDYNEKEKEMNFCLEESSRLLNTCRDVSTTIPNSPILRNNHKLDKGTTKGRIQEELRYSRGTS